MEFIPFPFQIGACPHHCATLLLSLNSWRSRVSEGKTVTIHCRAGTGERSKKCRQSCCTPVDMMQSAEDVVRDDLSAGG
jgi:hypothetical protein